MVAAIGNRRVLKRINRGAEEEEKEEEEEEEEEEETWGARVVQVQDREPRGRDDRMRQQVHCTSSFRDPVDLTFSLHVRTCTCTCTAYGAGLWNDTAETTEIELSRSARPRVSFLLGSTRWSVLRVSIATIGRGEFAGVRFVGSVGR